ncbi:TonB-linked SusC/RagA family outer membrane protein [Chitinophaga terrae (ex Kim and Jung 2007)]|uniref:SusC/RagA family TonB-linked outer membrane protein n=1 Tax=Chitinophaga terrae (ex Kim and Jung 2007) TaxID=408074 RepID=UPI00278B7D94|nr:SusC/RagA family TonB-linked outer membrane protein [Chitinophaga terrae (ex Kim and Jung 2007)]MDQ0107512.1 TonB-linked SusC/RagA family outer membrane protein [Chitinophaga terrae (ex Kim and Jung 2007)]
MRFCISPLKVAILYATILCYFQLETHAQGEVNMRPGLRPVTLNAKHMKLAEVFSKVWDQTGLQAFYNDEQLSSEERVTFNLKNEPLDNFLALLLRKRGLTWYFREETFVILPRKPGDSLLGQIPEPPPQPTLVVSGLVTDENNQPLDNVTITIKDTKRGAFTNKLGLFSFTAQGEEITLIISCVGYESKQLVTKGEPIKVQLRPSLNVLDEALVIGYGKTNRRVTTGAISRVSGQDIQEQPASNVLSAMVGYIPGLSIIQTTGVPGGNFNVTMRGRNSIGSGNMPLFILDGVPLPATSLSWDYNAGQVSGYLPQIPEGLGANRSSSPLNVINPGDIASIDVLKDADATSIYGSRGANGVILITTKKGVVSLRPQLNMNVYTGIEQVERFAHYLNTGQYLAMRHEAFHNDGVKPGLTDYDLNGGWDSTRNMDWQKMMLGGTAAVSEVQTGISGGTDNLRYMVSGNFRRESTVYPGDFGYRKGGGRVNLSFSSPNNRWRTVIGASYIADWNDLPSVDLAAYASTPPVTPEPYVPGSDLLNWAPGFDNPYAALYRKYKAGTDNLLISAATSYSVLPWLETRLNAGYNRMTQDEVQVNPSYSFQPNGSVIYGDAYYAFGGLKNWILEPQLAIDKKVGGATLSTVVGTTLQKESRSQRIFFGTKYGGDHELWDIDKATDLSTKGANKSRYQYGASFGRITYNLAGKYIMNVSVRRDGSSKFGPGKKFATFGAIGGAWVFSGEKWATRHLKAVSFGKIRASYGITGNDQIQDYDLYAPANIPPNAPITRPSRVAGPGYGWEMVKKAELGLELGLFKDHLLLWSSLYRNLTTNQIIEEQIPIGTGYYIWLHNVDAKVENKGMELELRAMLLDTKNFDWSVTVNYTFPNNTLLKMPNLPQSSYRYYYTVGQPLDAFKGLDMLGVDPQSGLYVFRDYNGDGKIDLEDFGKTEPLGIKHYGALINKLSFKGFRLEFMLQYTRQTGYSNLYDYTSPGPGMLLNQPVAVRDRWQNPGDQAPLQRFTQGGAGPTGAFAKAVLSDQTISDASYLRVRNLSVSYNMPAKLARKLTINNASVYIRCQNLVTFTHYSGRSPEMAYTKSATTPPLRICTFGIQLNL